MNVPSSDQQQAAATLAKAPFNTLAVASRSATLASLRSDPLARGSLLTLAGTAIVALALALLGLLLAVVGDLRDDRGELFDLEAQGAAPAAIRAHLRLRATLLTVFGVLGGLALGAILSVLVVSLVAVTAGATSPQPPLRLAASPGLLAAVGVGLSPRRCARRRRGDAPARPCAVAGCGGGDVTVAIELRDVFRVHSTPEGDAAALQGPVAAGARRRGAGRARSERVGQVDAAAVAGRARAPVGGRGARLWRGRRQAQLARPRALSLDAARVRRPALRPRTVARAERARAGRGAARAARRRPIRRACGAPTSCSSGSGSPRSETESRASCRAASSSGSRSAPRSRTGRRCSWPTSRPASSTAPPPAASTSCWPSSCASTAARRCS